MRRPTLVLALLWAAPAWAQSDGSVVVPPPPPIVSAPDTTAPQPPTPPAPPQPGLVQTPVPATPGQPAAVPNADQPGGAVPPEAAAPPPDIAPTPPNDWVQGKTATLGVLDEVDGSVANVTIPVGDTKTIGDLKVTVQACVIRPPEQLPDAALYLSVQSTDDPSGAPLYHGWMVRSVPGAAVVGDAGETFRVVGCA